MDIYSFIAFAWGNSNRHSGYCCRMRDIKLKSFCTVSQKDLFLKRKNGPTFYVTPDGKIRQHRKKGIWWEPLKKGTEAPQKAVWYNNNPQPSSEVHPKFSSPRIRSPHNLNFAALHVSILGKIVSTRPPRYLLSPVGFWKEVGDSHGHTIE